nr:MAG TPA: hypothetical protein [Caudoviricetes sp.]
MSFMLEYGAGFITIEMNIYICHIQKGFLEDS